MLELLATIPALIFRADDRLVNPYKADVVVRHGLTADSIYQDAMNLTINQFNKACEAITHEATQAS